MPRNTKLTPKTQEIICQAIKRGCYLNTASNLAGISYPTLRRWLKLASENDPNYIDFGKAVKMAFAQFESDSLNKINQFGEEKSDWRATAWILQHRKRDQWGKDTTERSLNRLIDSFLLLLKDELDSETFKRIIEISREYQNNKNEDDLIDFLTE